MKKIILYVVILLNFLPYLLKAEEGMWPPILLSQRINEMQKLGLKLSAEDIYSINNSSLKDAIVQFGGGCTGVLVSGTGLLLTNHHCGFGSIQRQSSLEHDYLKKGYWAGSPIRRFNFLITSYSPPFENSILHRFEDTQCPFLQAQVQTPQISTVAPSMVISSSCLIAHPFAFTVAPDPFSSGEP